MLDKQSIIDEIKSINKFVTEEDFLKAFKSALSLIMKREKLINEEFVKLRKAIDSKLITIKNGRDGVNGKDGKDGLDADEERIINEVFTKVSDNIEIPEIEEIENSLPKLGTQIRDALELLQGDDRLEISSIKDLREELDELKELRTQRIGGGGFSVGAMNFHFVDDETPSGTVNGTNKVFTINGIPSPATSLKVFVNGQRMRITEDYTFSGQTITFITAPPTGAIILCDYRT